MPIAPVTTTRLTTRGLSSAIQSATPVPFATAVTSEAAPPTGAATRSDMARGSRHRSRGISVNVWCGGGEGSVHSSVVAPAPQ